ncbi:unnamed protein product [Durusdinium trenchii]|uniref:Fe2OG dioxygenase domain-containing protein n=3 Tax=Durusdinium trenchii TaxID=1381693 RepID=A0ABP0LWC0_9DINO
MVNALANFIFLLAAIVAGDQYVVRDPVRVNYELPVQLKDGREVTVVTRSDFSTGLPVFEVKDLLTEEECNAIRSAAPKEMLERSETSTDKGKPISAKRAAKIFKNLDENRDKSLDAEEIAEFFKEAADMVDFSWEFLTARLPNIATTGLKVGKEEFITADWDGFFSSAKTMHPEWFARHSRQTWMGYSDHPFLETVLDKVAAVTGLSERLVRKTAEPMQVLLYPPHGGHYSCHHDTAPDGLDDARFMTVFFFLNDVADGGETVLFGTDLNGTFPEDRAFAGEDIWGPIESQCQSVLSCPQPSRGHAMPQPFSSALAVKPRMGTALFWYNMAVDPKGHIGQFYWSSIHGGCPTRADEKWAANVWLHARAKKSRKEL